MENGNLGQHREAILEIAHRHGVEEIRLIGSFARGEEGSDSDVDFLVKAGAETSPWFPGGLVADLEELLGRRVQIVTENGLNHRIRDSVLSEAIPL
jgi:predicted nucleotidyltransferase